MYSTAMKWRSDLIKFVKEDHSFVDHETWYYFVDEKTGTKKYLGTSRGTHYITEDRAEDAYEAEKALVMNSYQTELDMIVLPSEKWQYFDSTKYPIPYEPAKVMKLVSTGPYGKGMSRTQKDFNDTSLFIKNGNPSKILVRSGDRIDGIQFTYGGVPAPMHGSSSGKPNEINLGGDTKIIKVAVNSGDAVDGVQFFTDKGKNYKYGSSRGTYKEVKPPVAGAYLAAIKGKQGTSSVEALTFVWVYYA